MATLGTCRTLESFTLDNRLGSLSKLVQTVPNSPARSPSTAMNQTSVSFRSFHLHVPSFQTSTHFRPKNGSAPKLNELLAHNMSGYHPKSPAGSPSPQFFGTFSKNEALKHGKVVSKSEHDFNNTLKSFKTPSLVLKKTQSAFNPNHNKTGYDFHKTGFDLSNINQPPDRKEGQFSMLNASKTFISNDTLPLKRRGIDQNILKAYRSIINSKEHGTLQDADLKLERRTTFNSVRTANVYTAKKRSKTIETERDETKEKIIGQEEEKFVEELREKGLQEFHRKVTLQNFINGKYLMEPEDEGNFGSIRSNMKKFVSTSKGESEHKEDFWNHFSKHLSPADNLLQSTKAPKSRKAGRLLRTMETRQMTTEEDSNTSIQRLKAHAENMKNKEELSKQTVEGMKDLSRQLPKKKMMQDNEQLMFKIVKMGNELELGYLLAQFNELVKAEDNRKETPLHWAAKRGHLNIVACLCKYGADIDALDMAGRRPMDIAERLKREEVAEYLRRLHYKKEANIRFEKGQTFNMNA